MTDALPDQLRALAVLVDDLEESDVEIEIQDARLISADPDGESIRADLTVFAPIGPDAEGEVVQEAAGGAGEVSRDYTDSTKKVCAECGTDHSDGPCWEEDDAVADREADDPDDPEDDLVECDVDGCDYSTETERGLAIHTGRVHVEDSEDNADGEPTAREQVIDVLGAHGELPSTEIEGHLEVSGRHCQNVLAALKRDGRVESRQDPEDRRRDLYRLAGVESGEDDEEEEEADGDDEEDDGDEDEGWNETYPRTCCGTVCDGRIEWCVHRTEDHGIPQSHLDHLDPGEFETIVRGADSLQDILNEVDWGTEKTLRILGVYGLGDVVGPDGVELSDLTDYEFDGIGAGDDRDDEGDAGDDDRATESARASAADGGTAAATFTDYSGTTSAENRCANCGAHVDKQFAKVFESDEGEIEACPNCPDVIREGDGTVREKRVTKGGGA